MRLPWLVNLVVIFAVMENRQTWRSAKSRGGSRGSGTKQLINAVLQDPRLKGFHGLNPAFLRSPHLLTDPSGVPVDDGLALDRRNADLDSEFL